MLLLLLPLHPFLVLVLRKALPELAKAPEQADAGLWAGWKGTKAAAAVAEGGGDFIDLGSGEDSPEARRAEQQKLDADGAALDKMS